MSTLEREFQMRFPSRAPFMQLNRLNDVAWKEEFDDQSVSTRTLRSSPGSLLR
jgi:hypothetical protein